MNIYAVIILLTLVLEYGLSLLSNVLNLSGLSAALPEEMQSVYEPEAYGKSQEYTRVTTKFGFISSTVMFIFSLLFWFSGGFNWIDQIMRDLEFHSLLRGLLYIGTLIVLQTLVSLPFSIYSTFVIEARFGFNKTTPKLFVFDMFKGTLLSVLLAGPLLALLLAFFEFSGGYAWIYAWAVVTLFLLFVQFIAPTWIMPLFNTFKTLENGELKDQIMAYARSVHFPINNVFVMDGSKRSSKANAFFTGFGKNKRIALFDTLIESQTVPELVSILAHEIGHYKKKHIQQGFIIGFFHTGLMFFLLSIFISHEGLYEAFYMETPSVYSGLIFFGMLLTPIEFILSIFMNIRSRKNEYEADRFAAESVTQAETMIQALKKLSVNNLSNLSPHPFYVFLNYSHPPLLERIRAIRRVAYSLSSKKPHASQTA